MKKVKIVDLFAGLGGIRIGFENAFKEKGYEVECVLTSEIKPSAIQAQKENFNHKQLVGNIREIDEKNIEDFDFLLAGFPCQAFSSAGKGRGFSDTRGTLFFEIERILKEKQPYGFIMENVEGLIKHDLADKKDEIGETFRTILNSLDHLGYQVTWKLIDAQDFGVAQSRKRVYITGTKKEKISLEDFPKRQVKLEDVLEKGLEILDTPFTRALFEHYEPSELFGKSIKDKRGGVNNIHSWDLELKGKISKEQKELLNALLKERRKKEWSKEIGIDWMDGVPLTAEQISRFYKAEKLEDLLEDLVEKKYLVKEHPKKLVIELDENGRQTKHREQDTTKEKGYNIVTGKLSFEFSTILDPKKVAPTLVATDVSRIGVIDGKGIRKLTIREGLRLFGYPDEYTLDVFKGTKKGTREVFDLLGNTVVVPVIEKIAERLENSFEK